MKNDSRRKEQLAEKYYNEGVDAFHNLDYEKAIEWYEKAIELQPDYAAAYLCMGVAYADGKQNYKKAIECYEKAIEYKPGFAEAYFNMGVAYADGKQNYKKAIECYEKAIELEPDDADAYNNMGNAYADGKQNYKEAIECYKKAIELQPNYVAAYYNMGNAYKDWNGQYEKAIECYEKAIELQPNYAYAYNNMGNAYANWNKQYEKAIEYYKKAIKLNPNYAAAYNNMGVAYANWNGQYKEAIKCYKKAIKLNPNYEDAYNNMGFAYKNLGKIKSAVKNLKKGNCPLLDVLDRINYEENPTEFVYKLLEDKEYDPFFNEAMQGFKKTKKYKDVYIQSLLIMKECFVEMVGTKNDYEIAFAHYTKLDTAKILFFGDKKEPSNGSPFRLGISNTMNDPQEGLTLLNAMKIEQKDAALSDTYNAFIGSFTFNLNNLNQFRLYGKNNEGKEATGVSIVLNKYYFKDKIAQCVSVEITAMGGENERDKIEIKKGEKYPLFRCIYLDPDTGFVESVGHKDSYTLKQEEKNNIETYEDKIKTTKKAVQTKLDELKTKIEGLDEEVVGKLLLNLRYLVKHVAFKEEQECRIIQVEMLKNKKRVKHDAESEAFYIEYGNLSPNTEEVIFAPKVAEKDMFDFRNKLHYKGLGIIETTKSDLPYSS
ncbi:MAG: tetratricopeptide repeat protein [Bacteroidales bacterium]|jgi:tetratricopeptide (TPR) repeat protein|nr:tetratricopeptide repeat protein [Bacteroidales bacterium]